eukprot:CAMPEP_0194512594 /NCGR_PEP_ID=MMETSP0253-20130528/44637_1 /TAXON_ID=2966 /ORGANISM="Noctiluca scintillans" /LENGTH=94 /DNA_ID=CAMNT_0039356063 /DNA_START=668 /DNA_END=952 /DNA_ORIENTATION=+
MPVRSTVLPLTSVYIPVGVAVASRAMGLVIRPLALVPRPIWPYLHTAPTPSRTIPLSSVHSAALERMTTAWLFCLGVVRIFVAGRNQMPFFRLD